MLTPTYGLPAVNFFMADVGGGMGPFLSTWLAQAERWPPNQIGMVLSAGLIAGTVMSTPAGALIDRTGRPRLMLFITCLLIVGGTLAMFAVHGFWPIMAAQVLVASGGALGGPALTALTMATIGKDGFPKQQGINQAATHSGNVIAAGLVWLGAFVIGPASSIAVLALMTSGMMATLLFYPRDAVDHTRMAGREPRKKGEQRGSTRALLKNKRLLLVLLTIALFNFGSSAVLPLLGQRLSAGDQHNATQWMAVLVIVAQTVMVPMSWVAGHAAEKLGRKPLLVAACAIVPVRGVLAMLSHSPVALVSIEVLDGLGAGLISVAGPAAVADLTYGGGRTQTAMGALGTVQSLASALSAWLAGLVVVRYGWTPAYGMLAVAPLVAVGLLLTVHLGKEAAGRGVQPVGNAAASKARV